MAQVTDHHALIDAAGKPSDSGAMETTLYGLAAQVFASLRGWAVYGATLAAPGAIERAKAGLERSLIFPFCRAPGWFVDMCLPNRLGPDTGKILVPLGCDPGLPAHSRDMLLKIRPLGGLDAEETAVLLAADGSPRCPESSDAVRQFSVALKRQLLTRCFHLGYVKELPLLRDMTGIDGPAICVPFFAAGGGHVKHEAPEALTQAGFSGAGVPSFIRYSGLVGLVALPLERAGRDRRVA
ncbi:cobalamin biosynthesis protein CbiX [Marimonas arenosa]|uniref:Cobalamin biosynthesis protein CbiX n=1 Tax=Marimonas arenosa TaxID=1795305 RepID=A0AAE3WHN9_9RHOB|nr:cobalamin biosynthesis protein CbiX [Marimonas arenosa]MDQ2091768.1 cobalamin biosynthesis protein CbiX [Marimonas arenosa]